MEHAACDEVRTAWLKESMSENRFREQLSVSKCGGGRCGKKHRFSLSDIEEGEKKLQDLEKDSRKEWTITFTRTYYEGQ